MKTIMTIIFLLMAGSLWAQPDLTLKRDIEVQSAKISKICLSDDGQMMAYGTDDGQIFVWDLKEDLLRYMLNGHKKEISALLIDSENKYLVSGSYDKKAIVWSLETGQKVKELEGFKGVPRSFALDPDNKILACGGYKSKDISLWMYPSGFGRGKLSGHSKEVVFVSFGPNGDELMSVGADDKMIFWDIEKLNSRRMTEINVETLKNSGLDVTSADIEPSKRIAILGIQERVLQKGGKGMLFERTIAFYDWANGSLKEVMTGNRSDIDFIKVTPDFAYIITDNSTLQESNLSFWDTRNWTIEKNFPFPGKIYDVDVSLDASLLATAYKSADNKSACHLTLWQLSGVDGYGDYADTTMALNSHPFFNQVITLSNQEPILVKGDRGIIAVMSLDEQGVRTGIGKSTSELLQAELSNSPIVNLVERSRIDDILAELKLQEMGITEAQSIRIGKLLQADFILLGSLNKMGDDLVISARLVDVNTAYVIGIRQVTCTNAGEDMISRMLKELVPTIAEME
ncbi:MAG: CsgG/HfaB family protein [Candidatus Zixiibacteriota bacterium]